MRKVIIESPYTASNSRTVEDHIEYARACLLDSLKRGEAPIASHLLYTQEGILDDNIPEDRRIGIEAGMAWANVADAYIFYIDLDYSRGMIEALAFYDDKRGVVEMRRIL